jgi:hypothetical protein
MRWLLGGLADVAGATVPPEGITACDPGARDLGAGPSAISIGVVSTMLIPISPPRQPALLIVPPDYTFREGKSAVHPLAGNNQDTAVLLSCPV